MTTPTRRFDKPRFSMEEEKSPKQISEEVQEGWMKILGKYIEDSKRTIILHSNTRDGC